MHLRQTCFALLALLCSPPGNAPASDKPISLYKVERWTDEDVFPGTAVNAIEQTVEGYLWLGTDNGLVRFDGVRFVVYDRSNHPELAANSVMTLLLASSGDLWIGTFGGGLTRLRHDTLRTFRSGDGLSSDYVSSICEDSENTIWVGTDGEGVCRLVGDSIITYSGAQGLLTPNVTSCAADNGGVWIGTRDGLYRFEKGSIRRRTDIEIPSSLILSLHADQEGLWIGTSKGLVRRVGGTTTTFTTDDGLPRNAVKAICGEGPSMLVIGTEGGGVSILRSGLFSTYRNREKRPGNDVKAVFVDREGSIWVGYSSGGLVRLRDETFACHSVEEGLSNEFVNSVMEDSRDRIWVGTPDGLNVLEKGRWRTVPLPGTAGFVVSLGEDSAGTIWVSTRTGHLMTIAAGSGPATPVSWWNRAFAWCMYRDPSGTFWIGSNRGLFHLRGGKVTRLTVDDGLSNNDVRALCRDRDGTMWVGTSYGLNRLQDGNITTYDTKKGLSNDVVIALHADENGDLWIGTYGGLTLMRDGTFFNYGLEPAIPNEVIASIIEDDSHHLWMTGSKGFLRVAKTDLLAFADRKISSVPYTQFDKSDGLKSLSVSGTIQPVAWRASDGKLWFASAKGVVEVDPSDLKRNLVAPTAIIERVETDGTPHPTAGVLESEYSIRDYEIRFTAPSFVNPEKVRFRYMLEGFNDTWVDAGSRRNALYNNLSPGKYTLRVIAANEDGLWNGTGASLGIVVHPPYWMTWWFRGGIVVLVVLTVLGLFRQRIARLKREQRKEELFAKKLIESQEQERQRIAAELHDGLGQNVIVLKNRALLALRSREESSTMANQLEEIAGLASTTLEEIRQIAHNLRPANLDRFGLTECIQVLVENISSSTPVRFDARIENIDGVLPKDAEMHFFRIVQEAISNIIKHAQASSATVSIVKKPSLRCSITDNGVGFQPSTSGSRRGLGMSDIEHRVRIIGGSLAIDSAPGKGTTLVISVPLNAQRV